MDVAFDVSDQIGQNSNCMLQIGNSSFQLFLRGFAFYVAIVAGNSGVAELNVDVKVGSGNAADLVLCQNFFQLSLLSGQLLGQNSQLSDKSVLLALQSCQFLTDFLCNALIVTVTISSLLLQKLNVVSYASDVTMLFPLCPNFHSGFGTVGGDQAVQLVETCFCQTQVCLNFAKNVLLGVSCEYCGRNYSCYHAEHDQHCNTGPKHSRKTCFHNYLLIFCGSIGLLRPNLPVLYTLRCISQRECLIM